jgi:hypothetical protein
MATASGEASVALGEPKCVAGPAAENSVATECENIPSVPINFVWAENGDVEKATEKWRETLVWREENGVNNVLHVSLSELRSLGVIR